MSSLHAKNAALSALLLALSVPFGSAVAIGVALGAAVQVVNLHLLERTVRHLLGLAAAGRPGGVQALVMLRFAGLMGACAVVLLTLPVHPLGFAAGFSAAVPALCWHGLQPGSQGA